MSSNFNSFAVNVGIFTSIFFTYVYIFIFILAFLILFDLQGSQQGRDTIKKQIGYNRDIAILFRDFSLSYTALLEYIVDNKTTNLIGRPITEEYPAILDRMIEKRQVLVDIADSTSN